MYIVYVQYTHYAGHTRIQWSATMLTAFNVAKNSLSILQQSCHTPPPRPSWLWWLTPVLPTWGPPYTSSAAQAAIGSHWDSSPRSWTALRPTTVLSTGSFWLPSMLYVTSGSRWKAAPSSSGQTTVPSPLLWAASLMPWHHVSKGSSATLHPWCGQRGG